MTGQERPVQELGLLHDDLATRAHDARKLTQRPARLLDVEATGSLGQAEVRDEDARLGLLEEIHALQGLRERLGLGLCHRSSPVLAAASASSVYLASVRSASAVGQQ